MHGVIGGLKSLEPGWKRFSIKPIPGGDLTRASTSFESPYGLIKSTWEIVGDELKLRFMVPPDTEAEVQLPGGECKSYGSGGYEITSRYEKLEWPIRAVTHKYAPAPEEDWY